MPEVYSLEKPNKEEVEKLVKELKEYPELKPRLTFDFPLSQSRKDALEMIKSEGKIDAKRVEELLKSDDFIEKGAGLYILNKLSPSLPKESAELLLPLLEKLSQDDNCDIRKDAIGSFGKLGELGLSFLKKLSRDQKHPWLREIAIEAIGQLGELALPFLKELIQDKSAPRVIAIQALGKVGEPALPLLEKLSQDEEEWIRKVVVIALGQMGNLALPLLEKLSQDEDEEIRRDVALALGEIGETGRPLLEKLSQDEAERVRITAFFSLNPINQKNEPKKFKSWLLATKKPLFATPHTKELAERIFNIQDMAKIMADEFGDKFIGLTVFGSTAKGYAEPESDLDWGIVAKDKEVSDYFQKTAKSLRLCHEHYAGVDEKYKVQDNADILFYGLFFGNRKELQKLQKTALEDMGENGWENIRYKIRSNELGLIKAAMRFGIKDEEMEKIKQAVALLRVPPPYDEALRIVRKRAGK